MNGAQTRRLAAWVALRWHGGKRGLRAEPVGGASARCPCSADFSGCCIAGFQTRWRFGHPQRLGFFARARNPVAAADLEIGDTAGLETCATGGAVRGCARRAVAQPSFLQPSYHLISTRLQRGVWIGESAQPLQRFSGLAAVVGTSAKAVETAIRFSSRATPGFTDGVKTPAAAERAEFSHRL